MNIRLETPKDYREVSIALGFNSYICKVKAIVNYGIFNINLKNISNITSK
jgi:hypothetical protein